MTKIYSDPIYFNNSYFLPCLNENLGFLWEIFPPKKTQQFPKWTAAMSFLEFRDLLKFLLNKSHSQAHCRSTICI